MGMEMFDKAKPYIAMISLQFGYAGMHIITKMSLNHGMSHFVLVVYRHIVATLVLAPLAYFFERKLRPKMTLITFCQIFVLGLLGPVIDQNFYYLGLKFTSPTFGAALNNILPATTFVIAFIFRMEKIEIQKIRSQAKIVGTLVCVGGAMLMTFYKGSVIPMPWSSSKHNNSSNANSSHDNLKGCLCLITGTLSWASLFVLQASVLKKYPAQLSLVTLICLMGTLQSIAITLAVDRRPTSWKIGFDMNLLTAVYSGVIGTGVAYYLQGLCMKTKGPVFATAFIPLTMVITAIMDSIILHQRIYMGSVLGGVVIVIGLYGVLWGKVKDVKLPAFRSSEMLPTIHSTTDKNHPKTIEARGELVSDKGISNIKNSKSEET